MTNADVINNGNEDIPMNARALLIAVGLACAATAAQAQAPDPLEKLERQAAEAAQRAARETIDPQEIEMIKYRRMLMGKAGLQMYVVLLSKSGQPVDYFVTQGKCASSKKRLTPTHRLVDFGANALVVKAPAEDGTFGSSSPYIYCKTVDGRYKQWSGNYYASDHPIELTIKPLVVEHGRRVQSQH